MIVPNKAVSYSNSLLSKFPLVLKALSAGPVSVDVLYAQLHASLGSVKNYMLILDSLFLLGKIQCEGGVLSTC